MENLEKYGEMSIKSGEKAEEVVRTLVNAGFQISREGITQTCTEYEIFKKKE